MSTLAASSPVVPCKWKTIFNAWLHSLFVHNRTQCHSMEPFVDESQVSRQPQLVASPRPICYVAEQQRWVGSEIECLFEQYFCLEQYLNQFNAGSESDSQIWLEQNNFENVKSDMLSSTAAASSLFFKVILSPKRFQWIVQAPSISSWWPCKTVGYGSLILLFSWSEHIVVVVFPQFIEK